MKCGPSARPQHHTGTGTRISNDHSPSRTFSEVSAVLRVDHGQTGSGASRLESKVTHDAIIISMRGALAESGIEKWTVDTGGMTMTF